MMAEAGVGRPRSERSRGAILRATHELLLDKAAKLSIDGIARRAQVGKPTIYRWWPTLADVVLEALLERANEQIAIVGSTSVQMTLREFLRMSMKAITEGAGSHLRFLMAQAQQDEEFRERFRLGFVTERRAALVSILRQAIGERAADSGLAPDFLADLVFGAMWYRLLVGHAPLDDDFADELTEFVLAQC